jgi:hypothetical protein
MSAVRVYPGASNPTHELSLSDGVVTWGLKLDGGDEALKETPLTPSTLRLSGVSGFGAWEPGLAQIEQRDWSGGRGAARFSAQSAARFYDSRNAWTLSAGELHAAPLWRFARGLRGAVEQLPGDVSWKGLLGAQRYQAARVTMAQSLAVAQARVWLRRVGNPGGLSVSLFSDAAGAPGSLLAAAPSLDGADVPDVVSELRSFEIAASLSAGSSYHVVVGGGSADNAANHWELAVEELAQDGHASADGASWSAAAWRPYYRLEDAPLARNFLFFRMSGALYAADQRANGGVSHLYLNGERGVATSATANSLSDSHKLWDADQWAGAWVRIAKGKGAGQARRITANSAGELSVAAWDQTPDTTSEYLIYATEIWQDISPALGDLIDGSVRDVAVVNDHALLAQGEGVPILRVRFNSAAATPAHEFDDDGSNAADLLHAFQHPTAGPQVWRGIVSSGEVSRATPANWLTAMTFGTGIKVGERSMVLRDLLDWNGQLWALKADSFWQINDSDQARRTNLGLESYASERGAQPLLAWNGQIYFGWGSSLLASSGSSLEDVGPAMAGLPAGRAGAVAGLAACGARRLAAALDAGEHESSVLLWDGATWHEVLRAPQPGQRLRSLAWQDCPGSQPRLWASLDGELISLPLPRDADDPAADEELSYQHEAVLVGSTIDMEAARLPKLVREVSLLSCGLGAEAQVALDYQMDGEIGGAAWRPAGAFSASPLDTLALNAGPLHALRFRLRLLSSRAAAPARVQASVVEGFARTPLRYQWEARVKLADLQADGGGGLSADPDAFMAWLQDAARQARRIQLRSIWAAMDNRYVIVEPPTLLRQFSNSLLQWWGGTAIVKVREG